MPTAFLLLDQVDSKEKRIEEGRCAYIVYLRLCRIQTDRFATGRKGEEPKESGGALKLDRPKGNLKAEEHILKEEDLCYRVRYKIEPYLTLTYMLSLSWLHFMYPLCICT